MDHMTDEEFDLLDELYFVHSYQEIKEQLSWEDDILVRTLKKLLEKEWIRCFKNVTEEIFGSEIRLNNEFQSYHYLATKAGLLAHNGR
jgi:hypothetical protein